ncbi:MAG: hypothetical protein HYX61_08120 [Gammaproteobacteria bacterium]|nr:hypothetical protein [Gammaproteobacteria bacterium]
MCIISCISSHIEKILSLKQVLNNKGIRISGINSWYTTAVIKHGIPGVFAYLKTKDLQILTNKGGEISLNFNNGVVDFSDRPNYIGKGDGIAALKLKLIGKVLSGDAIIDIAGVAGDCKESALKVGSKRYPITAGKSTISISPNAIIEIESKNKDNTCYAVIADLKTLNPSNKV